MSPARPPLLAEVEVRLEEVAAGLACALHLPGGEALRRSRGFAGLFALVNGGLSIGLMASVAYLTHEPLVFPSLGPTAFLIFFTPLAASSSPRNAVYGHLVGIVMGVLALFVFGLLNAGPTISEGVSVPRIGAAAFSLGFTSALMIWLRVPHPPAGATTMIVSLGMITSMTGLVAIMFGVVLLLAQAVVINRFAGIDYPLWSHPKDLTNR